MSCPHRRWLFDCTIEPDGASVCAACGAIILDPMSPPPHFVVDRPRGPAWAWAVTGPHLLDDHLPVDRLLFLDHTEAKTCARDHRVAYHKRYTITPLYPRSPA